MGLKVNFYLSCSQSNIKQNLEGKEKIQEETLLLSVQGLYFGSYTHQ